MRLVHVEKKHVCNICDAKFKQKVKLDRHLKSVHRVKEENKSV